jgi:hypothetical protein
MKKISFTLLLLLASSAPAFAQSAPSQYVNMQGINLTPSGIPVNSTPALQIFSGASSPTGGVTTSTFKPIDSASILGGASNIRPLPTSGSITGEYWLSGNWTQTGTVTSNRARIHVNGNITFGAFAWTCSTEMGGGGAGSAPSSIYGPGGGGAGLGGAPLCFVEAGAIGCGGGGAGHGGAGGLGGSNNASANSIGGSTYPLESILSGSGGAGGASTNGSVGGAGGAGGGSLYVECTGTVTVPSGCTITASGQAGTAGANIAGVGSGGGGSGGGIQFRCFGNFSNAGSITASGGLGGSTSSGEPGGGGGGGIIDISSPTTTNTGTITAAGGAAGTGGTSSGTPGATGVVNLNSYVQNVRSAN